MPMFSFFNKSKQRDYNDKLPSIDNRPYDPSNMSATILETCREKCVAHRLSLQAHAKKATDIEDAITAYESSLFETDAPPSPVAKTTSKSRRADANDTAASKTKKA